MELVRVSNKDYVQLFTNPNHIYNSVHFSELNRNKCKDIHYLAFRDKKVRLGIILGEREDVLYSPFSAPFGGFTNNKTEKLEHYDSAAELLKQYGQKSNKKILLTLPPTIYGSTVAKTYSAFMRQGASMQYVDLNYQYELVQFLNFESYLDSSTRNKFHNSQKYDFSFVQLDEKNEVDVARAYSVIKKNRDARGFPLRMSLQQVIETVKIVPAKFFVLCYKGIDVAAAQIYQVTDTIAQVIYWGDVPEYSELRTMNYFTYKIFEFYHKNGVKILDIGPSSENGIPNYGLCEFKDNIGCSVSLKYTVLL